MESNNLNISNEGKDNAFSCFYWEITGWICYKKKKEQK